MKTIWVGLVLQTVVWTLVERIVGNIVKEVVEILFFQAVIDGARTQADQGLKHFTIVIKWLCRKGRSIANAEHAFTSRTYLNKRTLSYWEIWGSRINTGYQKWWRIGEESRINSRTSIKFCCNKMPLTSFICIYYVIFKLINHKLCNAGPSDPTPYLSLSHIYIGNHPIGPIS